MRILLVNVNTTSSVTDAIAARARAAARPGTEIEGLTPFFGPESVEGNFESYLAAVAVMDRVLTYDGSYDAVIQAGFGEHGREGLQELCDVPVVDLTDAAAHLACLLGHRFSVVTSLDRTVPQIEDRLRLAGLDGRCASVRASGLGVLDLERDHAAAISAIAEQARLAVDRDGAEVICLGCGGMAGLDSEVRSAAGAPVVDGVAAAVALAESLVGLGLTTSKVRAYTRPRPKTVSGWPLSTALGSRPPSSLEAAHPSRD
ncbi:aspartate/glutamate racemase family protein [Allosalinactinospora lopnorensis]|uniref:aspartate/glutamate racemase family protein n=1 Tax=Allosalinactinospora lopnorensis TaxID=1352348 RepID=UPI000623C016|nr:aspartate/glutamate racemase family protein [Allosalinactinospora lopnorensis]